MVVKIKSRKHEHRKQARTISSVPTQVTLKGVTKQYEKEVNHLDFRFLDQLQILSV